jgi:holliday junction DNA helicase RuvA
MLSGPVLSRTVPSGLAAPAPRQKREDSVLIAQLRGKPVARSADGIVLDVGGVGYVLQATPAALRMAKGSAEVTLLTYLNVREDALQLFGFAAEEERELFVHLLSVNGVGPKVALAVVSGSPAGELRRAIALGDAARFQVIPGIGKKTAERIVLELKEKLGTDEPVPISAASGTQPHVVARDALVELGWSVVEAEQALATTDPEAAPEERVRQALRAA